MYEFVAYRSSNELCWNAEEKGGALQVCVAGWRVPMPPPRRIRVVVDESGEHSAVDRTHGDGKGARDMRPGQKRESIVVRMCRRPHGGDKVRFDPEGPSSDWPTGSLFVPKGMLGRDRAREIWVTVEWMDLPATAEAVGTAMEAVGAAD